MLEVICNKAATCKIGDCGMKKPHYHFGCKPCHFDSSAKCVEVGHIPKAEISDMMHVAAAIMSANEAGLGGIKVLGASENPNYKDGDAVGDKFLVRVSRSTYDLAKNILRE